MTDDEALRLSQNDAVEVRFARRGWVPAQVFGVSRCGRDDGVRVTVKYLSETGHRRTAAGKPPEDVRLPPASAPDGTPESVVCHWSRCGNRWALDEVYAVDEDGHRLDGRGFPGRLPWESWLFRPGGGEDDSPAPVMGRAVTLWSFHGGVTLAGLHPPAWCRWLGVGFCDAVARLPNWWEFLDGGAMVHQRTLDEARKAVAGGADR